ncbi:MAG: DUF4375 domain-containing protein [Desulfobacterales bacterium]
MGKLKWLAAYSGQAAAELAALAGEYRTDSIMVAFEQAIYQKMDRAGYENLAEEERIILAVEALEREVNNGGYSQFFINTSKEYASIIVDALHRIGCEDTAVLTQEAIHLLGIRGRLTADEIDRAMSEENEERDRKLNACDSRYCGIGEDISEKLMIFIKKNMAKINLP